MSSEALSERELENAVNMATGILEKTAVSKHDTLGVLSHALLQTHTEAAEANESLSLIYDHVTRGRISKPNTPVREVMTLADDLERDFADQEVAERTKELETEAVELREENEKSRKREMQRNLETSREYQALRGDVPRVYGERALRILNEGLEREAAELREENDWMRRWMGEFGYTEVFEGWRKFKTSASDDQEEE